MLTALKVVDKTDGHNLFQILLYYFFKAKKSGRQTIFLAWRPLCALLRTDSFFLWLAACWLHFTDDNRTIDQVSL